MELLIAEKSGSVASVCKVTVKKKGVYKKNPTQTLEKLFPDYGMTDVYFSRWILLSKKTGQHKICFEISIKTVIENVMLSNHRMNSISQTTHKTPKPVDYGRNHQ